MRKMLLLVFVLSAVNCLANGSPIDESCFKKAGTIIPLMRNDISLKKENFKVTFIKDWALVDVAYTLENHGSDTRTAYAFPIEENLTGEDAMVEGLQAVVQGFVMSVDGEAQPIEWVLKPNESKESPEDAHPIWWAVAKLKFGTGGKHELKVQYLVRSDFSDMIYTKSFKPEFDTRKFRYSFELAKNWASSRPDLKVVMDVSALVMEGAVVNVSGPAGLETMGKGSIYSATYSGVDLAKISGLEVAYDRHLAAFSDYICANRVYVWSSELYPDEDINHPETFGGPKGGNSWNNLIDNNPATVWATDASPSKLPLHIKIKLKGQNFQGLGILNGDCKNKELYTETARVKSGRVNYVGVSNGLFLLHDRDYSDYNPLHPYQSIDWVMDLGDIKMGTDPTVDIEIDEVYPGTKSQNLCISELFLVK